MSDRFYAYRDKSTKKLVTRTYKAKAPATVALLDAISRELSTTSLEFRCAVYWDREKMVKAEKAKGNYELVTFVLVEESELESLKEDSAWLGHLEDAGVDNWQGIEFAIELRREAEGEDEE